MKTDNGNGKSYITLDKFLEQVQKKTEGKELRFPFTWFDFEVFTPWIDVYCADPESNCKYLFYTSELTIKGANRLAKKIVVQ